VTHTIQDVVETVFGFAGLDWSKYVVTDAALVRRDDRAKLKVDVARTRALLGWTERRPLEDTLFDMYEADCLLMGLSPPARPTSPPRS
jgi:GDPmannose 4,6-dehydratase